MRRFLYISPFFPPLCRVGAFRPLKFARHISEFNWQPVILCDMWPSAKTDNDLLETLPNTAIVKRQYSKRAQLAEEPKKATIIKKPDSLIDNQADKQTSKQTNKQANKQKQRIGIFAGREWLPLGDAAFNIPYALNIARKTLKEYDCEAIMVNADPVAALLVGSILSKETGLPLIADLRDPWGPCELRRPLRPFYTRWIEQFVEAKVIKQASKVILNTNTTLDHYKKTYPNVMADKFTVIRNHGDKQLINSGSAPAPEFDKFSLLFLGSFSRFVKADTLLLILQELKKRGIEKHQFQLVLTSKLDYDSELSAKELGVFDYIVSIPSVSYRSVGKLMENADMLTLILPTKQRIQAKFYDYLFSDRPILAIADSHPELDKIMADTQSGELFKPNQIIQIADFIIKYLDQGRQTKINRHPAHINSYTSQSASQKLADVLNTVVV